MQSPLPVQLVRHALVPPESAQHHAPDRDAAPLHGMHLHELADLSAALRWLRA